MTLQRAEKAPRFAGGAFDFISCCPPYIKVSYPELLELLARSPLIHEGSIVLVEYARESERKGEIPDTLGPLVALRSREYGRTRIVIYGPNEPEDE